MEARDAAHPTEGELARFVRGALARGETRAVVRHLLAGCERCRAVTRRLWGLGDPPGERRTGFYLEGGSSLMTDVEAARAEIREILRELKPLKFRLLGVAASLGLRLWRR